MDQTPHTLVSGLLITADLHRAATALAEWAGVDPPDPPIDEFEIDTDQVQLYLYHLDEAKTPSLLFECTLPPDLKQSERGVAAMRRSFQEKEIEGRLEYVLVDSRGVEVSKEKTIHIQQLPASTRTPGRGEPVEGS